MNPAPPIADRLAESTGFSERSAPAGRVVFGSARAWPWCVLVIAAGLGVFDPKVTGLLAPLPFVIALVFFGMPHGAADWTVAERLAGRTSFTQALVGFTGYLVMMLVCTLSIMFIPGVSILLFLALTIVHFGMADATAVDADSDGFIARWGLVLGRGFLLLSVAFAVHPAEAWEPFAQIGRAMSAWQGDTWMPEVELLQRLAKVGAASGVMLALVSAVARARKGRAANAGLDLVEHALVAVMAAFAHPLFAVGCFFFGVHAFRHTRRLGCTRVIMLPPADSKSFFARIICVHLISLPLMLPTAAALVALCMVLGGFTWQSLATASIAFYMITTLPHHLLGLRLPQTDLLPAA